MWGPNRVCRGEGFCYPPSAHAAVWPPGVHKKQQPLPVRAQAHAISMWGTRVYALNQYGRHAWAPVLPQAPRDCESPLSPAPNASAEPARCWAGAIMP